MRLFDSYRPKPPPPPGPEILRPDICVIGAGPGGLALAAAVAAQGVKVVLVERGSLGRERLDHGCLALKALVAAGRRAQAVAGAGEFGIGTTRPEIDFKSVMRHVREIVAAAAPSHSAERLAALGVQLIRAPARFRDKRTLCAGEVDIRARRFVIATGSSPAVPVIPGLDTVGYMTTDTVFDLTRKPGHLLVIGGDPAALELAQAFRRLGARVTLVEPATALGGADPEMAGIVLHALRGEGVSIRENAGIVAVEQRGKTGVRLFVETPDGEAVIDGSHLLIAARRVANVEDLDPEKAGIRLASGSVDVSVMLRTTNRRVYAIGDAVGRGSVHAALYHASLVLRPLLFRLPAKQDRAIEPWALFTDPELARIGLTEAEARKRYRSVRVLRWPYAENDRARAERKTSGHIKLVLRKDRVLGVAIAGGNAAEMIGVWALALANGLGLREMARLVLPYPTTGEIGKSAAIAYFSAPGRSRLRRVLLWVLRLFR